MIQRCNELSLVLLRLNISLLHEFFKFLNTGILANFDQIHYNLFNLFS